MLRGLVASCHGISKHPCSLGMVLLHSFAALVYVNDHAQRLFLTLFRRGLVPLGRLLCILW